MILFRQLWQLIQFLEKNLPERAIDELFYDNQDKSKWRSQNRPPRIAEKLRKSGFAYGITEEPRHYLFPEMHVLHWSKLKDHLDATDEILSYDIEQERLLSINSACKLFEVTRPTMYKILKEHKIPYVEILGKKRIQLKDLCKFIENNKKI